MINIPIASHTNSPPPLVALARNTFRLFFSSGGRIAIQLLLIPILARIVAPEAFGLIAMAMPVLVFTSILAEAGLITGLVRADIDLDAESSAFWFCTGVGVLSGGAVAAAAFPIGLAAGQPQLALMLLALAPSLVLAGLSIVPSARLQRKGDFAAFGKVEFLAAAVAAAAALAGALAGWNAFSLVAQQLALAGARLAGVLMASRFAPRLRFDFRDVKKVLRLSSPMLGANLLAYLSRSLDNLLIGLFVGPKPLGFYATAYQVIQIPEYVLGASARTAALPAIAQAGTREEGAQSYFASLRLLAAIATPIVIGCSLEADALVRLVLGPAWAAAGPLAAILAPLGLVWSCFQLNTAALAGLKDTRGQIRSSMITSVLGLAGILVGLHWGVRGVALGYAAGVILSAGPNFFYVLKAFSAKAWRAVGVFLHPIAAGALMIAAVHWWQGLSEPPLLQLFGAGALGLVVYMFAWMAIDVMTEDF